ncbi:Conjugal transfer protein trbk [Granulibacter bethesdensis]|uniref:Conjugal transfer protein trbk n=1 Tax=Granulibacter bethesdensis (strain ATCC BAA-1260 / CGDNIH1) TaxID=391165 RepID=Q0BT94_GRABC|nr:Conjugal transfer protein trbk [Granulibacter bethesdensis CGDNIH1]APG30627.1 Conjugal transfer protein trbk [Granulibacter bethesdensis]APH51776.1 Conjugal transfer protein trbk [Granulibacter bethesdensis]APH64468.1 Conjugal transfer protein trbk [Granulibacter bethesdensis]
MRALIAHVTGAKPLQVQKPVVPVTTEVSTAPADPMREALARCRFMGEVATRDPGCLKTWADNRRRFLGLERAAAPQPNGER